MTVACWLLNYAIVVDLRWFGIRARMCGDPRIVAVQFRGLGSMVVLIGFLVTEALPARHPYGDYACGFALAYTAWLIAFDVYHATATAVFGLMFGVKPTMVAGATLAQLAQPVVSTALLFVFTRLVSTFAGETATNWGYAATAIEWAFTSVLSFSSIPMAMVLAVALRWLQEIRACDRADDPTATFH
jgi:hypothetical protein